MDCGKTYESLKAGPEPMDISTWKHELLVVPVSGESVMAA
jgi:hypothetical protein